MDSGSIQCQANSIDRVRTDQDGVADGVQLPEIIESSITHIQKVVRREGKWDLFIRRYEHDAPENRIAGAHLVVDLTYVLLVVGFFTRLVSNPSAFVDGFRKLCEKVEGSLA